MTRRERQRGQNLVEVALVLPIFIIGLLALFDIGKVIWTQQTITEAAREGARVGRVHTGATDSAIRSAAKAAGASLGLSDAQISGTAGSCGDPVAASFYPDGPPDPLGQSTVRVVVHVHSTVSLITPGIAQLLGGSYTLNACSQAFVP